MRPHLKVENAKATEYIKYRRLFCCYYERIGEKNGCRLRCFFHLHPGKTYNAECYCQENVCRGFRDAVCQFL